MKTEYIDIIEEEFHKLPEIISIEREKDKYEDIILKFNQEDENENFSELNATSICRKLFTDDIDEFRRRISEFAKILFESNNAFIDFFKKPTTNLYVEWRPQNQNYIDNYHFNAAKTARSKPNNKNSELTEFISDEVDGLTFIWCLGNEFMAMAVTKNILAMYSEIKTMDEMRKKLISKYVKNIAALKPIYLNVTRLEHKIDDIVTEGIIIHGDRTTELIMGIGRKSILSEILTEIEFNRSMTIIPLHRKVAVILFDADDFQHELSKMCYHQILTTLVDNLIGEDIFIGEDLIISKVNKNKFTDIELNLSLCYCSPIIKSEISISKNILKSISATGFLGIGSFEINHGNYKCDCDGECTHDGDTLLCGYCKFNTPTLAINECVNCVRDYCKTHEGQSDKQYCKDCYNKIVLTI